MHGPYNSWGNGSAMRVSPVSWAFDTPDETLAEAERSATATHSHPEGIKRAQATAGVIFLTRASHDKDAIRSWVESHIGYDLDCTVDSIRPAYQFEESCQRTILEAIIYFFDGNDYEDVIRNAISLGSDSDTLACIAGSIAEAAFGVPEETIAFARGKTR